MEEYSYDGDGKRILVRRDSVITTYIYHGIEVLYEENTIGTASYIYGPTGRLAKRTTINEESRTFYYHTDHLGSTRLVTDENRHIVSAVTYHPFGETNTEEGSEHHLFAGEERDSTGLYYYGARYYDPDLGRFITRDLLKGEFTKPQTLNRYTYCLNNSLRYKDPWGLSYQPVDDELLSNEVDSDENTEQEVEEPEIIGNPSYENGKITISTTEGEVEVFNAHDGADDGGEFSKSAGGSWSKWKEKAYQKRIENALELLKEAEKLQAVADSLNQHAIALAIIAGGLSVFALALAWTGFGGLIAGAAAAAMAVVSVAVSLEASEYSKEAQEKREQAMKLLGG